MIPGRVQCFAAAINFDPWRISSGTITATAPAWQVKSPLAALYTKGIGAVEIHCVVEGQEAHILSGGERNHDSEIQAE